MNAHALMKCFAVDFDNLSFILGEVCVISSKVLDSASKITHIALVSNRISNSSLFCIFCVCAWPDLSLLY